jgi:hypothetical protein
MRAAELYFKTLLLARYQCFDSAKDGKCCLSLKEGEEKNGRFVFPKETLKSFLSSRMCLKKSLSASIFLPYLLLLNVSDGPLFHSVSFYANVRN